MTGRLQKIGIVLAIFGLVFVAGGAYAAFKVQEGYRSLGAFSAAQNVTLTYNEQGQLRSFVNIYVGDEDIRYLQGPNTNVPEGETVSIIPAIAGGN